MYNLYMQKIVAIILLVPILIAHTLIGAFVGGYQSARSEFRAFKRIMRRRF